MRLLRAAALLRDPTAKVVNVADECGFHHLGLFNTFFRRRFGACPTEWRVKVPQSESRLVRLLDGHPGCELRAQGLCAWVGKKKSGKATADRSRKASTRGPAGRPFAKGQLSLSLSESSGKGRKGDRGETKTPGASATPSGITFHVRV